MQRLLWPPPPPLPPARAFFCHLPVRWYLFVLSFFFFTRSPALFVGGTFPSGAQTLGLCWLATSHRAPSYRYNPNLARSHAYRDELRSTAETLWACSISAALVWQLSFFFLFSLPMFEEQSAGEIGCAMLLLSIRISRSQIFGSTSSLQVFPIYFFVFIYIFLSLVCLLSEERFWRRAWNLWNRSVARLLAGSALLACFFFPSCRFSSLTAVISVECNKKRWRASNTKHQQS